MFEKPTAPSPLCAMVGAIMATFVALGSAAYATPTFEPVFNPALETVRITEAIKIDGNLDDVGCRRGSSS